MRWLPLALICVSLAACGDEAAPAGSADVTKLTLRVDGDGSGPTKALTLELACAKPDENDACAAASKLSAADLAPTPADTACTQIYGGPETASIKGTLNGEPVDATFKRTDGCEIKRWDTVSPLLDQVR
jgi:hypothetical protein